MLAAVAAVLTALTALAPPAPTTVDVVRVRGSLPGGRALAAPDLRTDRLPPDALPEGAVTDAQSVVGRVLAARTADGQLLAEADLVGPRRALPSGHVVAPLRLADPATSALLSEGTVVDVLAADSQSGAAETVASGVRVVGVPPPTEDAGGTDAGGALVLVEVDRPTAQRLASAAVAARLSVVWR